ncbi:MAG: hypothetical protein JO284_00145 [Planctomycetaceae bacterium]|nr:hypothetical protein [Planctomycetaceae bacterium]MBV8317415.1 hypothetical protein [Planctomycetaceae bacterium]
MLTHRFLGEGEIPALPYRAYQAVPTVSPGAFVMCPPSLMVSLTGTQVWIQEFYRLAYQQALESTRPSWYERVCVPSVN